ncbi:MAG: tripartite tricarboxylate transporter substrate binding protein [Betaproteobacteria bacterium]|nr:tripartite tricarboxylate transporter substrate binding protein [Betaproteobacteria bacterium]
MKTIGVWSSWLGAMMAAAFIGEAVAAASPAYPTKPIRVLVGFPAGGSTDLLARLIGARLSEVLGAQIIVDNRAAAGGTMASELVAKGNPDGYTLQMATVASHGINPTLFRKIPYDPIKDFAPVTLVATYPLVLAVNPTVPGKSVKELIDAARAKPGQFRFSSSGNGTPGHLSGEIFKTLAKIDVTHVPYKGGAPANLAVLSGETHMTFATLPGMIPHVRAGKVYALAVTTAKRSSALPDVPAIAESLPGYDVASWAGLVAPAGTPRNVIARLHAETVKIIASREVGERLAADGADAVGNTPEQFSAFIKNEVGKWAKAIKQAGVQQD